MSGSDGKSAATEGLDSAFTSSLRDVIVDAGLEVLHRDGFRLQEETITYANVFRFLQEEYDVTVTRGSVHERIWASQEEFRFDVLRELICSSSTREARALEVAAEALTELPSGLTDRERLTESARLTGVQLLDTHVAEIMSRESVGWHSILATRLPGEQDALRRLNNDRSEAGLATWLATSEYFQDQFKLQPRKALGFDFEQTSSLAGVLIGTALSGLSIDYPAGLDLSDGKITIASGLNGSADWTPLGILMLAVVDLLFEPAGSSSDNSVLGAESGFLAYVEPVPAPVGLDELEGSQPARRDRTALRQLVLSAAVQMTRRDGFGLMPKAVTYKAAFDVVKEKHGFVVNRSSVHKRMWPSHDAFRLEVLAKAASRIPPGTFDDLFEAYRELPTPTNPDGSVNKRQRVLDNTRVGCQAHSLLYPAKEEHLKWFSLKAALTGQAGGAAIGVNELKPIFSGAQQAINQRWIDHFDEPFRRCGLKAKPELGLGWDRSIHLTAMLVATCSLAVDYEILGGIEAAGRSYDVPRIDGTNTTDAWSVKALGQRAIIEFLFDLPD